jgi:nucleotide-binding universal stress UspA family protein
MKILIAVDGSSHTQKALDYLVAHRPMFVEGNELVLVNVSTGVPGHVARHLSRDVLQDYYSEENAKVLEPVTAFLEQQGITSFSKQGRHGHAAEEILKAATEARAELIVMGTHGHGLFGRALMGSVATKVLSETDISVLLVQ